MEKDVDRDGRSMSGGSVGRGGFSVLGWMGGRGDSSRDSTKKRRNRADACSFVASLYCTLRSIRPGLNRAESNLSI